ncbi:GNAT family N-acetyltransferase [Streptomyces sp. NBC_01808]|uniref:GNAT family N-acetyltransferase n=1 Tax=Streptomyces sp. NBC_01808 TaxID=2975947 RepID=UPI002DD9DE9E|nr:GNAT family N-acetyltransferase [Streptomyces sp. NBC_01808]WSA36738.1 GNAT family N-acetyltransferase [Streptomyces sp. NBC_01808]
MTTHLRPAGAERREPGGGRTRAFAVCVNGRPIGEVELATDPRLGPATGRVRTLRIQRSERGRGRGTVAALAAEEVLRGWGCREILLSLDPRAEVGLRLAAALGYTETGRTMAKELAAVPELPPGSAVRPMAAGEYPGWRTAEVEAYAHRWLDQGTPPDEARSRAGAAHDALLPAGAATPDVALRVLEHEGAGVGTIWIALKPQIATGGYVYAVTVAPEHRGRGHGRTLMLAAERECLAAGLPTLGLHVFAWNEVARRLYESLDYAPTAYHLRKPLI